MKLLRYLINENVNINDLEKNCSQFLKEMKAGDNCFIRYTDSFVNSDDIIRIPFRSDRKPKDIPSDISEKVDIMLKSKFGWKPRSEGLFVWIDKQKMIKRSNDYTKRIIFPANNYKYVYSPKVYDLYSNLTRYETDFLEHFEKTLLSSYTNKNAMKVLYFHCECMISAPAYYAVSTDLVSELNDRFDFNFKAPGSLNLKDLR